MAKRKKDKLVLRTHMDLPKKGNGFSFLLKGDLEKWARLGAHVMFDPKFRKLKQFWVPKGLKKEFYVLVGVGITRGINIPKGVKKLSQCAGGGP